MHSFFVFAAHTPPGWLRTSSGWSLMPDVKRAILPWSDGHAHTRCVQFCERVYVGGWVI